MPNQSFAEQFDELYGRVWRAFFKADADDLTQHERQLLHHIGSEQGIPLGVVARHLGIPKSSASEQVKSLERRGFLSRRRDPTDERRLSIVLTEAGVTRVTRDSVLDLAPLAAAAKKISAGDQRALLIGLDGLVSAARVQSLAAGRGRGGVDRGRRRILAGAAGVAREPASIRP